MYMYILNLYQAFLITPDVQFEKKSRLCDMLCALFECVLCTSKSSNVNVCLLVMSIKLMTVHTLNSTVGIYECTS